MYSTFDRLGDKPEENRDLYNVEEIQNAQHKNSILSNNAFVCIDIYTNWCGPCKQTAPDYSMIAERYNSPGQIAIVKEDYDKKLTHPPPGGIPTFYFFYMGRQVGEPIIGADINAVEKRISEYVQSMKSTGMNQGNMNSKQGSDNPNQNAYHNRSSIRNSRTGPVNPPVLGQAQFQQGRPNNSSGPLYYTQN
jgi:thiol-disulfide isomerase/thioredoxin